MLPPGLRSARGIVHKRVLRCQRCNPDMLKRSGTCVLSTAQEQGHKSYALIHDWEGVWFLRTIDVEKSPERSKRSRRLSSHTPSPL